MGFTAVTCRNRKFLSINSLLGKMHRFKSVSLTEKVLIGKINRVFLVRWQKIKIKGGGIKILQKPLETIKKEGKNV